MHDGDLYDTPEEAALASWLRTPGARAEVVSIEPIDGDTDRVWVTVQTNGQAGFHDRDIATCMRAPNGKWFENGSTGSSS